MNLPKIYNNSLGLILFVVTLVVALFCLPSITSAQTTGALTVAPARQIVQIDPGESTVINVKFLNQGNMPITGIFNATDFVVTDSSGTPRFLDLNPEISTNYSASSWATLPYSKGTIAADSMLNMQIRISVPDTARPGGRYFGVYFEPETGIPSETGTEFEAGSGVATRIAALVYLRVSGPISDNAIVKSLSVPSFVEYGPVEVTTEILNLGNYHIRPEGKMILTNMLGRKVAEATIEDTNIFPETSRVFANKLGNTYLIGKYTVTLQALYGEGGKILTKSVSFWAFPWRLIIIITLAIIIIVLLLHLVWKNLKDRQKRLETRLETEITELEALKNKYKDQLPKK